MWQFRSNGEVLLRDLQVTADATLRWYSSSPIVERGFCSRCGGNVFWKQKDGGDVYVTAGTMEPDQGVNAGKGHIAASRAALSPAI
jgi:hypothetical protein